MSTWDFNQQNETVGDEAWGLAWPQGMYDDDWTFGTLDGDHDLWHPEQVNDLPPPHSHSPAAPAPQRNTFQPYEPRAANNTVYPAHDSNPPGHVTLPHPHQRTHDTRASVATPQRSSSNLRERPRPPVQTQQPGRFGYIVDHLFDLSALPNSDDPRSASHHSADFEWLEEESESSESEANDMAPTDRRRTRNPHAILGNPSSGSSSQDTSSQPTGRGRKRGAADSGGRASKRHAPKPAEVHSVEEIDLAEEAPSAEEELRQQQQREAIRAQQAAQKDQEPQRIGQRQCIICMENYTNATVTSCGHFFCHECLTQALMAGEKSSERGIGTCPVCRKPLSRRKKNEIIPIAFMKKEQFAANQRRRSDILA